jgi:alkylated DNA repair protein (DNA oxidative demethylase)
MGPQGAKVYPGYLDAAEQRALLDAVRDVVRQAPLVQPVTPSGKAMSVRITSAGQVGWVSDRAGYRYQPRHPSGVAWPPIPQQLLDIWQDVAESERLPETCLVNWYGEGARMGLHQDRDETDFGCPVVSVSLGDAALFRIGGTARRDPTRSHWLASGDVLVLGGAARMAWHGIDRTRFASSSVIPQGGRINLTMRVVT